MDKPVRILGGEAGRSEAWRCSCSARPRMHREATAPATPQRLRLCRRSIVSSSFFDKAITQCRGCVPSTPLHLHKIKDARFVCHCLLIGRSPAPSGGRPRPAAAHPRFVYQLILQKQSRDNNRAADVRLTPAPSISDVGPTPAAAPLMHSYKRCCIKFHLGVAGGAMLPPLSG